MLRPLLPVLALGLLPAFLAAQEPTFTVRGIVRDAAGAPVPGAEVVIGGRTARTSAAGLFEVAGLVAGLHEVLIRKIGYTPVHARVVVTAAWTDELAYVISEAVARLPEVTVEGRRSGIYGTVGDTGLRPLPGVRVQVMGSRGGEVLTDSLGRFAFPEASGGQYFVRVAHPGYAEQRMLVELKSGEGRELALQLSEGRSVMSRATDVAVRDLRTRLAFGLSQDRASAMELARRGPVMLCDLPRVRVFANHPPPKTVIINGTTIIPDDGFEMLPMLCSWQAHDLELVEFGTHVCNDVTRTIPDLLGVVCLNRPRAVQRSLSRAAPIVTRNARFNGPYLVIWERP